MVKAQDGMDDEGVRSRESIKPGPRSLYGAVSVAAARDGRQMFVGLVSLDTNVSGSWPRTHNTHRGQGQSPIRPRLGSAVPLPRQGQPGSRSKWLRFREAK